MNHNVYVSWFICCYYHHYWADKLYQCCNWTNICYSLYFPELGRYFPCLMINTVEFNWSRVHFLRRCSCRIYISIEVGLFEEILIFLVPLAWLDWSVLRAHSSELLSLQIFAFIQLLRNLSKSSLWDPSTLKENLRIFCVPEMKSSEWSNFVASFETESARVHCTYICICIVCKFIQIRSDFRQWKTRKNSLITECSHKLVHINMLGNAFKMASIKLQIVIYVCIIDIVLILSISI